MERLKCIKENLMCLVESQMYNLQNVDAKELGEAIDMIKDLEEAIYYKTITEAMHQEERHNTMYYSEPMAQAHWPDMNGTNWDTDQKPERHEGRSGKSRKMYMESKHNHADKTTQLRELERYMQELAQDITEMIEDSTPEEKQYLEKKITALATKVGSMK